MCKPLPHRYGDPQPVEADNDNASTTGNVIVGFDGLGDLTVQNGGNGA